jgi:hypothetical protein
MNHSLKILFFVTGMLTAGSCFHGPASVPERPEFSSSSREAPWAEALAYAQKHLPQYGELRQQQGGFAYIKVDDRYIHELFPLLNAGPGFEKPPYFRKRNSTGAHISMINRDEGKKVGEIGQIFYFTIKDIITVNNPDKCAKQSWANLAGESPAMKGEVRFIM